MITVDVSKAIESLLAYRREIEKKLTTVVSRTVNYWTSGIIDITPVGDSLIYSALYNRRPDNWAKTEGLLMVNWKIRATDFNVSTFGAFDPSRNSADPSGRFLSSQSEQVENDFKLGQTITLWNATPYAEEVSVRGSNGSELVHVKSDALDELMNTYKYAYSALT